MLWKNHFFKKNIHAWNTLPSPQHSIILDAIPDGELVTLKSIIGSVVLNKNNNLVKNEKQIKLLLDDLVKSKFVGEFISERIFRATKDL